MPRAEVGTPKYLANAMKSKGLQRLRWYCQVCEKQCRDENGFKCHMATESHLRQMLIVGESAGKHISDFSSQFQAEFVALLSRRYGTKRVKANNVYQEYIQDKHHLHMNATRWVTLTEFIKHLGRSGIARVDETEKGWFIAWVDNSPKALARAEANAKKEKLQTSDEQRERELLRAQIEKARREAEELGEPSGSGSQAAVEEGLKREEGEKVVLSFGKKASPVDDKRETSSTPSTEGESAGSSTAVVPEASPETAAPAPPAPQPATIITAKPAPLKFNALKPLGNPLKTNVFKAPKAKPDTSSSASSASGSKRDVSTMSAGERLMMEDMERKKRKPHSVSCMYGQALPSAGVVALLPFRTPLDVASRTIVSSQSSVQCTNPKSPMSMERLPVEVVTRIITETVSVANEDRKGYKDQLRNLILVCSQWKSIVNDTPAVWSRIAYDDGQDFVELALKKSQTHPLTIYMDDYGLSEEYEWFMEAIVKNAHRWLDVDLTLIPWPPGPIRSVLQVSAPILRSFKIRDVNDDPGGEDYPQLFKGPVPALETLYLSHYDVSLDPKAFTALEYLTVNLDYLNTENPHISPDVFAALLRNNPNLVEVSLQGFPGQGPELEGFQPASTEAIDLPRLRHLEIEGTTSPYVDAIVSFTVFPNNPGFKLDVTHDDRACLFPRNWRSFETRGRAKVRIEAGDSYLKASVHPEQEEVIRVVLLHDSDEDDAGVGTYPSLKRITTFLGSLLPHIRSGLRIQQDLNFSAEHGIEEHLRQMRALSRLELVNFSADTIKAFLQFLGKGPEYPFPALEALRIEKLPTEIGSDLIRILRARKEVAPLKVLEVPGLPEDVALKVNGVVGVGVLNTASGGEEE